MSLTIQQLEQFNEQGFLIVDGFFDPKPLYDRAKFMLDQFDPKENEITKFTTNDNNHIGNKYFLESGDKIRYFFEENMTSADSRSVNKIGHALHELDPVFKEFSTSKKVVEVAKSLGFRDCRLLQSMLIFKQPRIGSQVPPHVDSTFLYTEPTSCIGLWFALEDCNLTNGCMWFAPGSHKKYPLGKRFVRTSDHATTMIQLPESQGEPLDSDYVAAPVKAGDMVLIHGLVHHKSGENLSENSRYIYTFHMIEGTYDYPKDNWLFPTNQGFTKLY